MIDIVLILVIIALLAFLAWERLEAQSERTKFIHALIAKTPEQFRDLELTEKVKPIEPPVQGLPEFIPEAEIGDKKFAELIGKEVG